MISTISPITKTLIFSGHNSNTFVISSVAIELPSINLMHPYNEIANDRKHIKFKYSPISHTQKFFKYITQENSNGNKMPLSPIKIIPDKLTSDDSQIINGKGNKWNSSTFPPKRTVAKA